MVSGGDPESTGRVDRALLGDQHYILSLEITVDSIVHWNISPHNHNILLPSETFLPMKASFFM